MRTLNGDSPFRATVLAIALVSGSLVSASAGEPLVEAPVTVLHDGQPEQQSIKLSPTKVDLGENDTIKITVDNGVWCPGPGPTSGTITITVPPNSCGFNPNQSGNIDEGDTPPAKVLGTANDDRTKFEIEIEYSIDGDCGETGGTRTRTLEVNCNNPPKKTPTLPQWSLIGLVVVFAIGGAVIVRRRRAGIVSGSE